MLLLAISTASCASTVNATKAQRRTRVVTVGIVGGKTLTRWEIAWWQWRLKLSRDRAAPVPSSCIAANQHGPVWFMSDDGRTNPSTRVRYCSVPRGDYIMLTVPSIDCSTIEAPPFHAVTDKGLVQCAQDDWRLSRPQIHITVDGVNEDPPGALVTTPAFSVSMPPTDNEFEAPGRTIGRAAVEGFATMVKPFAPGKHTLVDEHQYAGVRAERVIYYLSVRQ